MPNQEQEKSRPVFGSHPLQQQHGGRLSEGEKEAIRNEQRAGKVAPPALTL